MCLRSRLLCFVLLAAGAVPAHAFQGPLRDGLVTNGGGVTALLRDDVGRTYVAGSFDMVGPKLGHGLATTLGGAGAPIAGFPDINGTVLAAIPDGLGGWFIGGDFTYVGGTSRNRLAHIGADRTLDASWNPSANSTVRALVLANGSLFAGGSFTQVGGVAHTRLAKISATGAGAVDATWLASSSSQINALAVIGVNLYVGAASGSSLARFATGGAGAVDPGFLPGPTVGAVNALVASGTDLFVGGSFAFIGGAGRQGLAKLDTTAPSGDPSVVTGWNPQLSGGAAQALALVDLGHILVGGTFSGIGGGGPDLLAQLTTTGTGTVVAGWDPNPDAAVGALAVSGNDLILGGDFSALGAQPHRRLAKVAIDTGAPVASWDPNAADSAHAVAISNEQVLAAGDFATAGPQVRAVGSLIRLGADGTLDETWDPKVVGGAVNAIVLSGTTLYATGAFTQAGTGNNASIQHPGLAKISTTSATVDHTWRAAVIGGAGYALALDGDALFVGGLFSSLGDLNTGSVAQTGNLGLVSAATGEVSPTWHPRPDQAVRTLAVSGSSLFAGGVFTTMDGGVTTAVRLAKLSTASGAVDTGWNPGGAGATVNRLLVDGTTLYAGGLFTSVGGVARNRLARLSTTGSGTVDPLWDPDVSGPVEAVAISGADLYAAGTFSTVGGASHDRLARISTTGKGLADDLLGPATGSGGSPLALLPSAGRLLVAGAFESMQKHSLRGLATFDLNAPSLSISLPIEGGRYPQRKAILAAFSCADPDGTDNIASCLGTATAGTAIDTAAAGPKSFTATVTDAGGNTATQTVNYVVDGSTPSLSITSPEQAATYRQGDVVHAAYSCTDVDGDADLTTCAGPVADGAAIDTTTGGKRTFTVTATDIAGNTATTTVVYTVSVPAVRDTSQPVLTRLRLRPAKFTAKHGSTLTWTQSEAGKMTVTVLRPRKGGKPVTLGSFTVRRKAGVNQYSFGAKLKGKALKPGRYRLTARVTDAAGHRSNTAAATFTVLKA